MTSDANVVIGPFAGQFIKGGSSVHIGYETGQYASGSSNTFVGQRAGENVTGGNSNTIVGRFDGNEYGIDITGSNTDDNKNVIIADGAGKSVFVARGDGLSAGVFLSGSSGSNTYSWGKFWKKIINNTSNNAVTLATVGSYSGNDSVYFRVRLMAAQSTGHSSTHGVT